jgi:chemotaxis protein CheX
MNSGINVDYINPFIEATIHTFQTMCSVTPVRTRLALKGKDEEVYGVCGIIGLAGEATGAVVLNFPEQVAVAMVSTFVGETMTEISPAVMDGVGELANIIAGDARNRIMKKGYAFEIGLPKIVAGRSFVIGQNRSVPCLVVTYGSEFGSFSLEVSLKKGD